MSSEPFIHLRACPGPHEGMCKEAIVLGPTPSEMFDEMLATAPVPAFQVPLAEGAKQQLGLVQPGCMGRSSQHTYVGIIVQEHLRIHANMTRSAIPDQVNPPYIPVRVKEVAQCGSQMVAIIGIETPSVHTAGRHEQRHHEVDSAMTNILELAVLDVAWSHWAGRTSPFECLEVGHLIDANDKLSLCRQFPGIFIAPQDTRGASTKFLIERRRLPVTRAVRSEVRVAQDQRNRRMCDVRYKATSHRDARQRSRGPVGHVKSNPCRCATCQLLNLHTLQGGKTSAVGPTGKRRRVIRPQCPRSVGRRSRWSWGTPPDGVRDAERPWSGWPWQAVCVPDARGAVRCDHCVPVVRGASDLHHAVRSIAVAVVSSF